LHRLPSRSKPEQSKPVDKLDAEYDYVSQNYEKLANDALKGVDFDNLF
jgi:hypothetical protein